MLLKLKCEKKRNQQVQWISILCFFIYLFVRLLLAAQLFTPHDSGAENECACSILSTYRETIESGFAFFGAFNFFFFFSFWFCHTRCRQKKTFRKTHRQNSHLKQWKMYTNYTHRGDFVLVFSFVVFLFIYDSMIHVWAWAHATIFGLNISTDNLFSLWRTQRERTRTPTVPYQINDFFLSLFVLFKHTNLNICFVSSFQTIKIEQQSRSSVFCFCDFSF